MTSERTDWYQSHSIKEENFNSTEIVLPRL